MLNYFSHYVEWKAKFYRANRNTAPVPHARQGNQEGKNVNDKERQMGK